MNLQNKIFNKLFMGNKRMRIRHTPAVKLKMKTSTRVIIVTGVSVFMLGTGFFMYMNFSNIGKSKAAIITDRTIFAAQPKADLEISSRVVLPLEQQPATKNNPEIINRRKAVNLNQ